jgi:hypothetical protein
MSPLLQDKLLDLLINIISIVLGGGLVILLIEWRRHQRERSKWAVEDAMVQIDIPRAEMHTTLWQLNGKMSDRQKVQIYENNLEGTISRLIAVIEFVIRNTTGAELVITSYDVKIMQIPSVDSIKEFFELDTLDLISKDDFGAIRLKPLETIPRCFIFVGNFGLRGRLEKPPTTAAIEVYLSNGNVIQGNCTLNILPTLPDDIEHYQGYWRPRKYVERIRPPEEEIPF